MFYRGEVRGGVVLLPSDATLAEGTEVLVVSKEQVVEENEQEKNSSIWSALSELGRVVESRSCDLPADLARNHDHYLRGLAKRS